MDLSTIEHWQDIPWDSLRFYAAGRSNAVFTRPGLKFIVKVGRIDKEQIGTMRTAHKNGFGVPVFGTWFSVPDDGLPAWVRHELRTTIGTDWRRNIVIMGKARPMYRYRSQFVYNQEKDDEALRIYHMLRPSIQAAGLAWWDNHRGNIGFYQGKTVVLDGLSWAMGRRYDSLS